MKCPRCDSQRIKKNGSIHNKKHKYQCNDCKRQFVENPENIIISHENRNLVDRLLLEKIPLAGIARSAKVSERWLQGYVNDKYEAVPREIVVTEKPKGALTMECDEM
jgi:insertion element IS1 protein InsB